MVENPESQYEGTNAENFSASKNDLKPDTEEILRRQGPEFEPTPENITERQQSTGQGTSQLSVDPTADPVGKTDDANTQQKNDTELAQELEKLKQDDEAYTKQRLSELRDELQQFQPNNEEPNQQNSSEVDQEEEHSQGIGQ